MPLLSGDIQLNPGPVINNTCTIATGTAISQGVDTQLNTMIVGSLEPSLIPADISDCTNLAPQLDSITEGSMIAPQEIKQSRSSSSQDSDPTLLLKTQAPAPSHLPLQQDRFKEKIAHSRAAFQQKGVKYFQTVNHAKVIWDSKKKNKGITGGLLNIRSIIPKRDQIQHLLMDSNLDFLALTETWLSSPTLTTMIYVPGYTCF